MVFVLSNLPMGWMPGFMVVAMKRFEIKLRKKITSTAHRPYPRTPYCAINAGMS